MKALGILTFGFCCFLAGTEFMWIAEFRVYETPEVYRSHERLYALWLVCAILQAIIVMRQIR